LKMIKPKKETRWFKALDVIGKETQGQVSRIFKVNQDMNF